MIVKEYKPLRIYQWGSLLEDRHFSEISDIDIAVEGITDTAALSGLRAAAEQLTYFQLDIVAIEHVHPAYAEHIRHRGRVVYER
jgi:predicted nucleotidyltransferase